MSEKRKFPAPWRFRETHGGYLVEDAQGRPLLYCYAKTDREASASVGGHSLTWQEAEGLAMFVASFPSLYETGKR